MNNSGTARADGCLSPSFSRLESDTRRREAFFSYWDSNAFVLGKSEGKLVLSSGSVILDGLINNLLNETYAKRPFLPNYYVRQKF